MPRAQGMPKMAHGDRHRPETHIPLPAISLPPDNIPQAISHHHMPAGPRMSQLQQKTDYKLTVFVSTEDCFPCTCRAIKEAAAIAGLEGFAGFGAWNRCGFLSVPPRLMAEQTPPRDEAHMSLDSGEHQKALLFYLDTLHLANNSGSKCVLLPVLNAHDLPGHYDDLMARLLVKALALFCMELVESGFPENLTHCMVMGPGRAASTLITYLQDPHTPSHIQLRDWKEAKDFVRGTGEYMTMQTDFPPPPPDPTTTSTDPSTTPTTTDTDPTTTTTDPTTTPTTTATDPSTTTTTTPTTTATDPTTTPTGTDVSSHCWGMVKMWRGHLPSNCSFVGLRDESDVEDERILIDSQFFFTRCRGGTTRNWYVASRSNTDNSSPAIDVRLCTFRQTVADNSPVGIGCRSCFTPAPEKMCSTRCKRKKRQTKQPLVEDKGMKEDVLDAKEEEKKDTVSEGRLVIHLDDNSDNSDDKSDDSDSDSDSNASDTDGNMCAVCLRAYKQPVRLKKCGHVFCHQCLVQCLKDRARCPLCRAYIRNIVAEGDMPSGTMVVSCLPQTLPGYEDYATILIRYSFDFEENLHYHDVTSIAPVCLAFLPACPEGFRVLRLLWVAFTLRLSLSVNPWIPSLITWNIEHKTHIFDGPQMNGYPDQWYLTRVKNELAQRGITEEFIQGMEILDILCKI